MPLLPKRPHGSSPFGSKLGGSPRILPLFGRIRGQDRQDAEVSQAEASTQPEYTGPPRCPVEPQHILTRTEDESIIKPVKSVERGWECTSCKYMNQNAGSVCALCYTLRAPASWVCGRCAVRNTDARKEDCSQCGAHREATISADRMQPAGRSLSPRSAVVDMFLRRLLTVQIDKRDRHNHERGLSRSSSLPSGNRPSSDLNTRALTTRPNRKQHADIMCDRGHYLRLDIHVGHHCDSCNAKGTKYRCFPCNYDLCLRCAKKESGDIHSDSSWSLGGSSSASDTPASSSWVQYGTSSTCDETNKEGKEISAREKEMRRKKMLEMVKLRRQRGRRLARKKKMRENMNRQSHSRPHFDDEWDLRAMHHKDSRASSIGRYLYGPPTRVLPSADACCRDLLVMECGHEMANGEYAQYENLFRNTYNAHVVIVWDEETRSFLHMKCRYPCTDMDTLRNYMENVDENFQLLYINETKESMQPLAIPAENWVTVDEEKWGKPGKYIVTSLRVKHMLKAIEWKQRSKEYNTVMESLCFIPPEILCKILIFGGIGSAWSWAGTCVMFARDLEDPDSDFWEVISSQMQGTTVPGKRVARRRRFSLCVAKPAEVHVEYTYPSAKEMCRDSNRMNVWLSLLHWHRPGWQAANPVGRERQGVIANISLDTKRSHLVLHIVHNLACQNATTKIDKHGARIAKFREKHAGRKGLEEFTGMVLLPYRQEVVYERLLERHVLAYFDIRNEEPSMSPSGKVFKFLGIAQKKHTPFWERGYGYYYVNNGTDKSQQTQLISSLGRAENSRTRLYAPVIAPHQRAHLFDLDLSRAHYAIKGHPLNEFFECRATTRCPLDTFAVAPEVLFK